MNRSNQLRTYEHSQSVVFFKTKEAFGGLSNMASGFPLRVNGVRILTSEALYQACRFPHMPDVQRKIISENSPMTAKMKGKPYRSQSRADWDMVRTQIMRWCLRVKLAQNWKTFGDLLQATGNRPIVEQSRKDDFWGAKETDDGTLIGINVLGRLLMELREELRSDQGDELRVIRPLPISEFLLYGRPIQSVSADGSLETPSRAVPVPQAPTNDTSGVTEQASFFDSSVTAPRLSSSAFQNERALSIFALLKPYPNYKRSCINWLGNLPEHWDVKPGLAAFREKLVKNTGLQEKQVLSLSYGHIIVKPKDKLRGLIPSSFSTYQIVEPSDIIIRSTDLQNDKTSLRVGHVRNRGIITSAYICLRTTPAVVPNYGYQLLNSYDLMKVFYGMGSGLRQNLAWADFKRMPVPIPPCEEQIAITKFLSHATRRIDRVIQAKRRVIAFLNEQKRSIVRKIVTNGLRSHVLRKESGIPWLETLPAHWSISRLKFEASHIVDCLHATPNYLPDGDFPAIRTADIEPGKVRLSQARKLSFEEFKRWTARLAPMAGDILYSREGERFGIAALVPVGVQLCISQRMMVFRIKESQCSEYIMWQLNCPHIYAQASADIIGSTSPHVNIEQIKNFRLAIPPLEEQREIVAAIRAQTIKIDSTVATSEREISFLREYRTRLIADVVTGKLDVRAVAVRLPDDEGEQGEPIPLEDVDEIEIEDAALAGAASG
jgi:type I restriction enzyme S subunit